MRIALATTTDDTADPQSWSGIPWHLALAMGEIDGVELGPPVGPLPLPRRVPEGVRKVWYEARGQRYAWQREPRVLDFWSRRVARELRDRDVDVVLALGSIPARCLPPGVPHVIFTDATWDLNVDYYPTMTGMCARSRRLGEDLDRTAYTRADHVVITSEWGRRNLVEHYGLDPARVTVTPIGANITCDRDAGELETVARRRLAGPLRLFWIGVEWERKGGSTALAVAAELDRRGVPVELHVAGRTPELEPRPWLHHHGFLNFTTDRARTQRVFLDACLLLLPTTAEDSAIVFAEAASFAAPSIAPATGGVPTMVEDGVSGVVLREDASPLEYVDALEELWNDPERYLELAASSRQRYEREMTWTHVAQVIRGRLDAAVRHPRR